MLWGNCMPLVSIPCRYHPVPTFKTVSKVPSLSVHWELSWGGVWNRSERSHHFICYVTFQPDTQGITHKWVLYEDSPTYTTGNPETGDHGNYVLVQADALTGDSLSPRKWVIKGMDLGESWKKITKTVKLWEQSQVGQGAGNRACQVRQWGLAW